ncbi:MAG TPA: RDD family protein [Bacteroidia bacterium]|nr:RDD family protein [Bacteroidia bacterium]
MHNPIRKKITELFEERHRTKEVRDENGNLKQVDVTFKGARFVRVITGWSRFLHYLIDLFFVFCLAIISGVCIGIAFYDNPEALDKYEEVWSRLLGIILTFGYYFVFEAITGTTPGKMILGRIVIDEYGERPNAARFALRTVGRLVPFEPFSCLGERGWHDTWSKTFVVSKQEAEELKELLQKQEAESVQQLSETYQQSHRL